MAAHSSQTRCRNQQQTLVFPSSGRRRSVAVVDMNVDAAVRAPGTRAAPLHLRAREPVIFARFRMALWALGARVIERASSNCSARIS